MSQSRWVLLRVVIVGLVVAALLGATGSVALAVPEQRWRGGEFLAAGVPVYARSVDGWACHVFGVCRDEHRQPGDPQPDWYSQRRWENVEVECYLGHYFKIHQPDREGWVLRSTIRTYSRIDPCTGFDF